jgi:hypothetical protein
MKDYKDILPFLKSELAKLEQPELHLSFESILQALGENGSDEADDAVRKYAASLIWPPVPDPVRFELCLRLSCAIWWIETLYGDTETAGETVAEFLTETMIGYWRDVGRADWAHNHFVNPDAIS